MDTQPLIDGDGGSTPSPPPPHPAAVLPGPLSTKRRQPSRRWLLGMLPSSTASSRHRGCLGALRRRLAGLAVLMLVAVLSLGWWSAATGARGPSTRLEEAAAASAGGAAGRSARVRWSWWKEVAGGEGEREGGKRVKWSWWKEDAEVDDIEGKGGKSAKAIPSHTPIVSIPPPLPIQPTPDPRYDRIAIALKTGHDTAASRASVQLLTFLSHVRNVLVIGDYPGDHIGPVPVVDVYNGVLDEARRRAGLPTSPGSRRVERRSDVETPHVARRGLPDQIANVEATHGWATDAHKNLPGFQVLHHKFPDAEWYLMIDDDTYLFMDNLLAYVAQLNPDDPREYRGSVNMFAGCDGVEELGQGPGFAHGGSGILVGRAAMRKLVEGVEECIVKYHDCWAGDVRTALCLRDQGILVQDGEWFNGDPPNREFDFPDDACVRPKTFHHLAPHHIQWLYEAEQQARRTHPARGTTMADVYARFHRPSAALPDHDRGGAVLASAHGKQEAWSAKECERLCREWEPMWNEEKGRSERCWAWVWDGGDGCWLKGTVEEAVERRGFWTGMVKGNQKILEHSHSNSVMLLQVGEPTNPSRLELLNENQKASIELSSNNLLLQLDKRARHPRSKDASSPRSKRTTTATFKLTVTMPVDQMDRLVVSCFVYDENIEAGRKKRRLDDVEHAGGVKKECVVVDDVRQSESTSTPPWVPRSSEMSPEAMHDVLTEVYDEEMSAARTELVPAPKASDMKTEHLPTPKAESKSFDVVQHGERASREHEIPRMAAKRVDSGNFDFSERYRRETASAERTAIEFPSTRADVKAIMASSPAVNDKDTHDASNLFPLHAAAAANDEKGVLRLLATGADCKQRDSHGKLPIEYATLPAVWKAFVPYMSSSHDVHGAAWKGDTVDLMLQIADGHNILHRNKHGENALHVAVKKGHEKFVQMFLANGGRKCLHEGAFIFIGKETSAQRDITPFHLAAASGFTSIVKIMLNCGANLDKPDGRGRTALSWAVRCRHFDIATILVLTGANVNEGDNAGWTPFLLTSYFGPLDLVKLMVENKASLHSAHSGRTALALAKESKQHNREVVTYLRSIGVSERDVDAGYASQGMKRKESETLRAQG
ncbi:hypothetical protein HDU96_007675 [Phlyctochytrium bullatum]|nr:hypothetical protein HDU96_007675 [Phlyctochytrium bullatum]